MDWLRRNWPDLLIGLALVAVIAGIVATLLTGGSFFPGNGAATGPIVSTPPSVDAPASGATSTPDDGAANGGAGLAGSQDPPSVAVPSRPGEDEAGLATPDAGPPGAPDPQVDAGPTDGPGQAGAGAANGRDVGAAPDDADGGAVPADPDATADAGDAGASGAVQPLDPAGEPQAATEAPGGAGASAADGDAPEVEAPAPDPVTAAQDANPNEGLPTEPYRVSVGAFGDPANAQRQAETFRAAGYPVFVGSQGALSIVLVGPYGDEGAAREVAAEIRDGDFGIEPVIYRFEPDETGASATASNGATLAAPVADGAADGVVDLDGGDEAIAADAVGASGAGAASGAASAPAASASGTLLQVGAYVDADSAAPQLERLEGLGFDARTLRESDLVKLVVGPFEGQALADARVVLEGADIPFFAR